VILGGEWGNGRGPNKLPIPCSISLLLPSTCTVRLIDRMKKGSKKEGGKKEGRKKGRKEVRKNGRKKGRKEGTSDSRHYDIALKN